MITRRTLLVGTAAVAGTVAFGGTAQAACGPDLELRANAKLAVTVRSRSAWGADESYRFKNGAEVWRPEFFKLQAVTVHHVGYDDGNDPLATLRSVYKDQAVTQGFGDIGYHLLIDWTGAVYEGRYSGGDCVPVLNPGKAAANSGNAAVDWGRAVNPGMAGVSPGAGRAAGNLGKTVDPDMAAGNLGKTVDPGKAAVDPGRAAVDPGKGAVNAGHVNQWNAGNVGVCLLHNLSHVKPTQAALDSLARTVATLCAVGGLDPVGMVDYVNPVNKKTRTVPAVSGHRDWAETECPGNLMYPLVPDVRQKAKALIG